ncbi:MAG: DNA-directed RNA polymerase subunit P [Candidatus Altiarchaeota archaeon]|nr:DNA-directed RNA polymerase subunit P [Candidatus Altiarchaeota archaeon]
MTYICMECGNEVEYDYLLLHKLKCTKCRIKRSNIWVKKRPEGMTKVVLAK